MVDEELGTGRDLFFAGVGGGASLTWGRPDIEAELADLCASGGNGNGERASGAVLGEGSVAVFVCGPTTLAKSAESACARHRGVDFHAETFEL